MEKDKSQNVNESSFPPSRRNSLDGNKENEKSRGECDDEFSNDISRMLDSPPKYLGHRRALSDIITLPDDISFDIIDHNGPSYCDETEEDLLSMMYLDVDKFNSSCGGSRVGDSSFSTVQAAAMRPRENDGGWSRVKHEHSVSMDSCSSIKPGMLISSGQEEMMSSSDAKKSISDAKLAELALVDPKHAKRILANRQSAARSKERKMRYMAELERKIQILQTEASSCSAQLALLQRDTNGLTAENNELKLHLQSMKQQIHMQDAFNNALKEEIHRLKILTGQNLMNGGSTINFRLPIGANHPFHPTNNHPMNTHQFHQLQNQHPIQPQPLLHQQQFHQIPNQHPFQEQHYHQKHQHPSQQHPGHRSSLST